MADIKHTPAKNPNRDVIRGLFTAHVAKLNQAINAPKLTDAQQTQAIKTLAQGQELILKMLKDNLT